MVIGLGFWMVIPVFGPVFKEKKTNARSLAARLSAEFRFLKKHRALESYVRVYLAELKPKMKSVSEEKEIEEIEQALHKGVLWKYRDTVKTLEKLQTLTERL
jgi:hypothetical protein